MQSFSWGAGGRGHPTYTPPDPLDPLLPSSVKVCVMVSS